jgi:hypothetical protein
MADIAQQLNNVFTRDGLLGPLDAFKIVDGTVNAPGIAFNSELSLGLFRESGGVLGVAAGGQLVARFSSVGVQFIKPPLLTKILVEDGTKDLPAYTFFTEPNTGLFKKAAGNLVVSVLGKEIANFAAVGMGVVGGIWADTLNITGSATFGGLINHTGDANIRNLTVVNYFEFATAFVSRSVINKAGGFGGAGTISIGWNGQATFKVDATDFGALWPMSISGNAATATDCSYAHSVRSGGPGGAPMTFTYAGVSASPAYVWGSQGAVGDNRLYVTAALSVAQAGNANTLGGYAVSQLLRGDWAVTAGFISNQINYPYIYKTDQGAIPLIRNVTGVGALQQQPRFVINYYDEAQAFQGYTVMNTTMDDQDLSDIAPSTLDALGLVRQMELIQYRHPGQTIVNRVGFSGQNLQAVDPQLLRETGGGNPYGPDPTVLMPLAFKAIQELEARVAALEP